MYTGGPLYPRLVAAPKKFGKLKKTVHKFKNARQARTGRNMVKLSSPNTPSTWLILLCPHTHASQQTCHHSASSVLAVRISCRIIAVFVFRKQKRRMEESVNTHNRLKYFLTNKIFLLQVMYRYIRMIFIVIYVTMTRFFIACAALWWKIMIFIVLSLETVHGTVQYRYCIFSLLNRLVRIRLKRQNPLLSYVWERESTLQMSNVVYSTLYYYFI